MQHSSPHTAAWCGDAWAFFKRLTEDEDRSSASTLPAQRRNKVFLTSTALARRASTAPACCQLDCTAAATG
eukprot:56743-Chlamydomonas_euryale.AAC.8